MQEPLLAQLGQHVGEAALCALVVRRDVCRELYGLHEQGVYMLGEVVCAAPYPIEELLLAQAVERHGLYLCRPFRSHVDHLLAQSGIRLVVQLHQVGIAAHEVLGHESHHGLLGSQQ